MTNHRAVLVGCLVVGLAVAGVPTASAHHAYDCGITDDPDINRAYCAPHCTWDAITGGHWKSWVSYIQQCVLG